jgi:signal peptidase I
MDKHLKFSYADQKRQQYRIRVIVICVLAFFTTYVSFTSLIFSMRVVGSNSMQPSIHARDRFIFSSYMFYLPELRRGSIVLIDMGEKDTRTVFSKIADGALRFFTFQRASLSKREEYYYLKRVAALPGDEVSMINFVLRVKPKDSPYRKTEFELSECYYNLLIPPTPALWDESLPFSGNMDPIILEDDQCFLLSDDRSNTNDSRTWGAIPIDRVRGRGLFRYWPLTRFGRP